MKKKVNRGRNLFRGEKGQNSNNSIHSVLMIVSNDEVFLSMSKGYKTHEWCRVWSTRSRHKDIKEEMSLGMNRKFKVKREPWTDKSQGRNENQRRWTKSLRRGTSCRTPI